MTDLPFIGYRDQINRLYVLTFAPFTAFSAVAHKTGICPFGGVAEILHSDDSGRFRMYLACHWHRYCRSILINLSSCISA
jgi:hypothetical protein